MYYHTFSFKVFWVLLYQDAVSIHITRVVNIDLGLIKFLALDGSFVAGVHSPYNVIIIGWVQWAQRKGVADSKAIVTNCCHLFISNCSGYSLKCFQ